MIHSTYFETRLGQSNCVRVLLAAAVLAILGDTTSNIAIAQTQLVATKVQDEPLRLPQDNTVSISARKRSFNIDLQYYADANAPTEAMLTLVTPGNQRRDVQADTNGKFVVSDPTAGLYALFARTAVGLATIPFYVKASSDALESTLPDQAFPDDSDQVSEEDNTISVALIDNARQSVEQISEQYVRFEEPKSSAPIRYDFQPEQRHGYQVRQDKDGRVNGRVIIPTQDSDNRARLANNNLFLLKNGVRIENQISSGDGSFVFPNTSPGFYGLVAAGPAGYTAFQFEVLASDAVAKTTIDSMQDAGFVVASAAVPPSVLPVLMIPPQMAPVIIQIQREESRQLVPPVVTAEGFVPGGLGIPGVPFAGGGFSQMANGSGGGFGGGGGGGGGGGFGGLGGLAGIAALAPALINNDGNSAIVSPPAVSQSIPNNQ